MENPNKLDIFDVLSELLKFRLDSEAEKKFDSIVKLLRAKDKATSTIGYTILLANFHDSKLVGAIVSKYKGKKYGSSKYEEKLEGSNLLGYQIFRHFTTTTGYGTTYTQYIFNLDKKQYKKHYRRCEAALKKLKKFNRKYKLNTDN